MTQPPAGGFPPPDQPGGYPPPPGGGYTPPPTPAGPPPGGFPPPGAPAGPPPGAYQPPPGVPQGPPPGAPQAPPGYPDAAAGYPPPPPGGYPPPGPGGYPPPQAGYGQPPAAAKAPFDMSKVGLGDWIVLGIGVLMIIFGFFGWVSVSSTFGAGGSLGGWHTWWIIIQLLLLAIVIIRAVQIFTGQLVKEIAPVYLVYGAVLLFVLYVIALINIFASYSQSYGDDSAGFSVSSGPGFGIWASLILSIAFVYFLALSAQAKGSKLPFAVPGPKL